MSAEDSRKSPAGSKLGFLTFDRVPVSCRVEHEASAEGQCEKAQKGTLRRNEPVRESRPILNPKRYVGNVAQAIESIVRSRQEVYKLRERLETSQKPDKRASGQVRRCRWRSRVGRCGY